MFLPPYVWNFLGDCYYYETRYWRNDENIPVRDVSLPSYASMTTEQREQFSKARKVVPEDHLRRMMAIQMISPEEIENFLKA
jgi:hypothetical protein